MLIHSTTSSDMQIDDTTGYEHLLLLDMCNLVGRLAQSV
jgi:hypothetical protein